MTGPLARSQGAHRGRLRGSEAGFQGERLRLQRKLLGQEVHPHPLHQPYVALERLLMRRGGGGGVADCLFAKQRFSPVTPQTVWWSRRR